MQQTSPETADEVSDVVIQPLNVLFLFAGLTFAGYQPRVILKSVKLGIQRVR